MNAGSQHTCARRRAHRASASALVAFAAALSMPLAATAATLVVDADGTHDAANETCNGSDPSILTINAAHAAASDGDTIFVCPGTYVETQVQINKAITLQGSGAALTIIDGGGGTGLASAGTIRIRTNTGNVTVDGFTIQNPSAQGASPTGLRFGISAKSSAPVTYTITNNVIKGMNNPAWGSDYGVYTDGPAALETFVFQHNTVMQTGSNPILIERHAGPTDVSFNTFDRGVYGGGISAYFNMSHSGDTITSLQRVSNNVIHMANDPGPYTSTNASGAITFYGAFTGTTVGRFTNVEISGNVITGLESYRRGITVINNSAAPGTNGEISNAVIACNSLSGPPTPQVGSVGLRIIGLVSNPDVSGNSFSGVETAFLARDWNTHIATGITLEENSFTNIGVRAIDWWSTTPLAAESNWFGDASGPTEAGNPSGTGAAIGASGGPGGSPVVDYIPWLGSGNDADPSACFVPGDSTTCAGVSTCDLMGCTAPPVNEGGACDDGLYCNGADTCSAGACVHAGDPCAGGPECANVCDEGADSCNVTAGSSCTDDGDVCTLDECDGAGACTHPLLPDADADGDCDDIDACTSIGGAQTFGSRPRSRVVMTRINTNTTPGDDTLSLSASFTLPVGTSFADVTPDDTGVRLVVLADDGAERLDAAVPAGDYTTASRVGWKRSGNGKSWTFVDRTATPASGIIKVVINDRSSTRNPRLVKVRIIGKKGSYPVVEADLPIQAIVTLGGAAEAAVGLCGESAHLSTSCVLNKPENRLVCQR